MILIVSILLFLVGVLLSALFSGSETGFYRASRVRVVIAGLDGDRISQYLIKLMNNPTLFLATTLIGNNVANYLTSLAIVLIAQQATASSAAEMLAPVLVSPLLFVYGELLPKNLFFRAPNSLLRLSAPLFLFFTCLFAPLAALLWGMGRLLERSLGESPEKIRLTLARKELQQVLQEGLDLGILHPTQRHLGQSFFLVASKTVGEICTPISRVQTLSIKSTTKQVLKLARRKRMADIPLFRGSRNELVGYVRTVELMVNNDFESPSDLVRKLTDVKATDLFGEIILQMQSSGETLVRVVGQDGKTVGLLSVDQLTDPLLNGPLGALKR